MSSCGFEPYKWTCREYDIMIAKKIFHPGTRLELIEGDIIRMSPRSSFHATAVSLAEIRLRSVFSTDLTHYQII